MRHKGDGDDAIRKLDRTEYGYKRRPLRVEWASVSVCLGEMMMVVMV
jgi:arginine/serine-rich splicing factor 4/5/6